MQALRSVTLLKSDSNTSAFLWILRLQTAGSECTTHVETNHLIWNLNQMTGFYWGGTLVLSNLKGIFTYLIFFLNPHLLCCEKGGSIFFISFYCVKSVFTEYGNLQSNFSVFSTNVGNNSHEKFWIWKLLPQRSVMFKEFHGSHWK